MSYEYYYNNQYEHIDNYYNNLKDQYEREAEEREELSNNTISERIQNE